MEDNNKTEIMLFLLRKKRNKLLRLSDIYVLSDFPHPSEVKKNEWISYRQSLRELPNNIPDITIDHITLEISGVTWPTIPT